jgi:hypothetical protein
MKNTTKLLIISSLFLINSCASRSPRLSYDLTYNINLDVAKDKNKKENYVLKRKIIISEQDKSLKFEDAFINVEFDLERQGFGFVIKNKTNDKVKIHWKNAFFSDNDFGTIEIKKYNLDDYEDVSTIIPESFYENTFYPYKSSKYSYFPEFIITRQAVKTKKVYEALEDIYDKFVNKPVQILIPLEINGELHEYRFIFNVNEINLEND